MKPDIKLLLAKRLRELRKQHGLTQQKLAELAGVDYKHIQLLPIPGTRFRGHHT